MRPSLPPPQTLGKYAIFAACAAAVVIFLIASNGLVRQLAVQEREHMDVWAEATRRLADADSTSDVDFLLTIISRNTTIPVLVADDSLNITEYRNFNLPDGGPSAGSWAALSERDRRFLTSRLKSHLHGRTPAQLAADSNHVIPLATDPSLYIYYEDSSLLQRLSLYPYVEIGVMLALALIVYLAVRAARRAEQNRVWVGLSKETAHQLGTPISSIMAWTQYLETEGADPAIVREMDKDVARLHMIAERFSKIGSEPELERADVGAAVRSAAEYMRRRISARVSLHVEIAPQLPDAMLCAPLLGWVVENLMKNAVDAMDGAGSLRVEVRAETPRLIAIEVADTGRGIPRKLQERVFRPGFTTKPRGWGLGLALARRIITSYHRGRIFVKESAPGRGTTFRIELPAAPPPNASKQPKTTIKQQ